MSIIQAILLGAVQGVTSFLPVSSSGHVELLGSLMGIGGNISVQFITLLHLGSLIAVILAFYKDILKVFLEFVHMIEDSLYNFQLIFVNRGKVEQVPYKKIMTNNYRRFTLLLIMSLIPTLIIGLLCTPVVSIIYGNMLFSGVGMMITALLLMVSFFAFDCNKGPKEARNIDAVLIGVFQGFSFLPGVSRMAMVESAGFLARFSRKFVIKYSFLLAIPTTIGALIVQIAARAGVSNSTQVGVLPSIFGMIAAAIVSMLVIGMVKRIITQKTNLIFSFYCLAVGILSIVLYLK